MQLQALLLFEQNIFIQKDVFFSLLFSVVKIEAASQSQFKHLNWNQHLSNDTDSFLNIV